jgi:type IV secretion system protein VirB4
VLNLRRLVKNYDDSARSFSELVPWMLQIAPNMVINKDGSLLACYEFYGMDAEGAQITEVDRTCGMVEHAMRVFDERFTVWWTMDRRRTMHYPDASFEDPFSEYVNEVWKNQFIQRGQYINRHFVSILYTPPGGVEGVFEKVAHYVRQEEMPLSRAVAETLKSTILKKAAFSYEYAQLERFAEEFSEKLTAFEQILSDLTLLPLRNGELLGFLNRRCSPSSLSEEVAPSKHTMYLDSLLPTDTMISRGDTLLMRGTGGDRHLAAISVKDWPDLSYPGLLDVLMAVPGEITISQCLRMVSSDKAKKVLEDIERHNRNMSKSFKTYMIEAFSHQESGKVDHGRIALAEDARDAITEMSTHGRVYGYYNLTILTHGKTSEEADELTKICGRVLAQKGFLTVRENMHLLSCFTGSFPGQAGTLVRWSWMSTANLADLAPARSLKIGNPYNSHFTEQFSTPDKPFPALTALPTEYATPYYFNFHQADLAHTLVVGPSRSGKSAFNNFLISLSQKYQPSYTFIFDKDYSCKIPTLIQGGEHVDIGNPDGEPVKLNPMNMVKNPGDRAWLVKWIEVLLTAKGDELNVDDERDLWEGLVKLADQPEDMHSLSGLGPLIPKRLHGLLQPWIGDGAKASFFDNEEDSFSLGRFTCVEMGHLFKDAVVARAFIDYAFYRISKMLDGRPTLIYVEEAWFLLGDEQFAKVINDWLRTLAKKNAWIMMATQSLDEAARSEIFAAIIDNIPNRIFLPNPNAGAHEELYTKKFGLNIEQFNRVRNGTPKLDYYIVTPVLSRMVQVSLPKEVLAVVRSDSKAQKVFSKHWRQRNEEPNWKTNYLKEMINGD